MSHGRSMLSSWMSLPPPTVCVAGFGSGHSWNVPAFASISAPTVAQAVEVTRRLGPQGVQPLRVGGSACAGPAYLLHVASASG